MELKDYSTADALAILTKVKLMPSEKVESDTVEFKEYTSESALHNDKNLVSELCAFANKLGGILIVGVRDSTNLKSKSWEEQLVGFQRIDEVEVAKRVIGRLRNLETLHVENITFEQKNYLAFFVQKDVERLVTTSQGKTYIRVGRESRPMTPDEITTAVKSLHGYDWSSDLLKNRDLTDLSEIDLENSFSKFSQLKKWEQQPKIEIFLESVGMTSNGQLTKGGLLFLGKTESIRRHLGDFEFRFTWKEGTELKLNEVWSGNLWGAINKAKELFKQCVTVIEIEYNDNKFSVPNLDEQAFHEAFVNAIVHRDYSKDGMVSVEFTGEKLTVVSPGQFYGGVNSRNITWHEPRHRNKCLARILMEYGFVDRAGMGVLRMGVKSLIYGRPFPSFEEHEDTVRVVMAAEHIRPGIFVLTKNKKSLYIPDLIFLNALYQRGWIEVDEAIAMILAIDKSPWETLDAAASRWELYIELVGNKEGVFLAVKKETRDFFDVKKVLNSPSNKEKFVELFRFLKKYHGATNEEISDILGFGHSSSTSRFLGDITWIERSGDGVASRWRLIDRYQ